MIWAPKTVIRRSAIPSAMLLLGLQLGPTPARAENPMGYRLQSAQEAAGLQRSGGSLGMKVGAEHQINSGNMTFELLKVEGVGEASPAAQAGLKVGDQLIAVDGRVFPNVATFAEYVGSVPPGRQIEIDYMPAGAGPGQAQRVGVTVGQSGHAAQRQDHAAQRRAFHGRQGGDRRRCGSRHRLLRNQLLLAPENEDRGRAGKASAQWRRAITAVRLAVWCLSAALGMPPTIFSCCDKAPRRACAVTCS